jgi:hypothetical protein
MSLHSAGPVVLLLCIALTPTVGAQKGGSKPSKPVDQSATAVFRCNGPTAQTREPAGTLCGPTADSLGVPDAITGDGEPYIGVLGSDGLWTGAVLRSDGELLLRVRALGPRFLFLNFEEVVQPPGVGARKTFDFADLNDIAINSNVIDPSTGDVAINGALAIPPGSTWPTRIKGNWVDPYGQLYTIRFNPDDYPGSTHARVTRTGTNSWTLWATEIDIARLVTAGSRHKGPVDEGWYTMPFEIAFTVP